MRNVFKVILAAAVFGIITALLPYPASAQGIFGDAATPKSKRKGSKKPTQITSETLDADIGKNIIVFTGDVFVDDDDMTIKCHKLTIFLEEKDQGDDAMKKNGPPAASGAEEMKGKKELRRILCEEDVVLVRKVYDALEKEKGDHLAVGGRAVYDLKTGKIELTENNPSITRGEEVISADKITMWRDQQKAKFEGNVKTSFKSAFEGAEGTPAPEQQIPAAEPGATQTIQTPQAENQSSDDQERIKRKVYTGRIDQPDTVREEENSGKKADIRDVIVTDQPESAR